MIQGGSLAKLARQPSEGDGRVAYLRTQRFDRDNRCGRAMSIAASIARFVDDAIDADRKNFLQLITLAQRERIPFEGRFQIAIWRGRRGR